MLFVFATIQYFRHFYTYSPYTSDSLFYKHIYYELNGNSFSEARDLVLRNHNTNFGNVVENNIFMNEGAYIESYPYFANRIFYPIASVAVNFFFENETFAFLLPVFLGYIGSIAIIFMLFKVRLGLYWTIFAILMVILFPPFIGSMSMFMTDSLGVFFWLLEVAILLKLLKRYDKRFFLLALLVFELSLFNREYSVLSLPAFLIGYILYRKKMKESDRKFFVEMLVALFALGLIHFFTSSLMGGPSLFDYYARVQNRFGIDSNSYTSGETLNFWKYQVLISHKILVGDIANVWYLALFVVVGVYSMVRRYFNRQYKFIDAAFLGFFVVSYLLILIFPNFSYRYFLMSVVVVVYFATLQIKAVVTNN